MSAHRGRVLGAIVRAPTGAAALGAVALLVILAVAGPVLFGPQARAVDVARAGEGPTPGHPFGTDRLGRDVLARTLTAGRLSLGLALAAAATAAVIGFPLGALISVLGGRARAIGLRVIEILLAFPPILLAIFVTAIVGPGAHGAVVAIGIAFSPNFARLANTLAAAVAGRDYVAGARVIGIATPRLLSRYIVPNIADTLSISIFNAVGSSIIAVSSLSFLGLGVQAPQFDWGSMLTEGVHSLYVTPAAALAPAAVIAIAGLSTGFLGEALARAMNPLLWTASEGSSPAVPAAAASVAAGRPATAPSGDAAIASARPLLEVDELTVQFPFPRAVTPVRSLSFSIREAEIVGVVGESGSGKSLTALAIAQLVPYPGVVTARALRMRGRDLRQASPRDLGTSIAMVFQDPMASLNPALRVGLQLAEATEVHRGIDRRSALAMAAARLRDVHIPAPDARLGQYPHEFSGGMRQRAMIAMALMNAPALIIADEPTTALDVTVQAQIIDVLQEINRAHGAAVLLISHDIGVVAEICTRVLVMYAGRIVEDADLASTLRAPAHPYTQALVGAVPTLTLDRDRPMDAIPGRPPDLDALPAGCAYAPRCPLAVARCKIADPPLDRLPDGRRVACWVAHDHA